MSERSFRAKDSESGTVGIRVPLRGRPCPRGRDRAARRRPERRAAAGHGRLLHRGLQACPTGWIEPPNAAGRLVVGVPPGHEVGGTVGLPLGEQENRKHLHPFTAEFRVPAKAIEGSGDLNRCCANYGTRAVLGEPTTGESTSNLPFIQLLLCEKL